MQTHIRPAAESDLPNLHRLHAELHPDDPQPAPDVASEVWRAIEAQAGRTILVAERDDTVIGTVDCVILPNLTRGARPFMLVENVVVASAHRRSGAGRRLMDAAVELARESGCYKVQLLTAVERGPAHALYEAAGFQPVAQGFRRYLGRTDAADSRPHVRR